VALCPEVWIEYEERVIIAYLEPGHSPVVIRRKVVNVRTIA
jgi:hypothetical protein